MFLLFSHYVKTFCEAWFARPASDIQVLDWGCGRGQNLFLLKKQKFNVRGADLHNAGDSLGHDLPILKHLDPPVTPLTHPYEIPFEDRTFDVVISFGVLEHVPSDVASLSELHRILKPGGLFFIFNLPYTLSWTQRLMHLRGDYSHDRLYTEAWVRKRLPAAGFNILDLWHRQLLPKNTIHYPAYHVCEWIDQFLTHGSPLKYLATSLECVAEKKHVT